MNKRLKLGYCCWTLAALVFLIAGCAGTSAPVTFYTLNPLAVIEPEKTDDESRHKIAIGIGPVVFPGYLDRTQIVTRIGQSRINISEFHRWADSLKDGFSRVLVKNVSVLLPTHRVAAYPWQDDFAPDYQIKLNVEQFDGQIDGIVVLNVAWSVVSVGGADHVLQTSVIKEHVLIHDHEGLVTAMSRTLATLSREIVEVLRGFKIH